MEYKHFSHEHNLSIFQAPNDRSLLCNGCKSPCYGSIFACWSCRFFLHDHCANATRFVKHPSHVPHPLILMPSPTYCSGSFVCDGCCASGDSFSYSCALCEVDLHVSCAFLPQTVRHNAHQHALCLCFRGKNTVDFCGICGEAVDLKQWSYVCEKGECGFRVHTFCGSKEVNLGQYQDVRQDPVEQGEPHPVRADLTPEQEMVLEIGRMNLELQLVQGLANIIAYK